MSLTYAPGDMCVTCETAPAGERSRTEPYGLLSVCDDCRGVLTTQALKTNARLNLTPPRRCSWAGCLTASPLRALIPNLLEPWQVHWLCLTHFGKARSDYVTENLYRVSVGQSPLRVPQVREWAKNPSRTDT